MNCDDTAWYINCLLELGFAGCVLCNGVSPQASMGKNPFRGSEDVAAPARQGFRTGTKGQPCACAAGIVQCGTGAHTPLASGMLRQMSPPLSHLRLLPGYMSLPISSY